MARRIAALTRARELDPTRRETHERLGLAWWMAGDGERALAALADAVAIDPEARRPHFRRMVVLDQLGRHEEAAGERALWLRLFGDGAVADRLADLARHSGHRAAMVEWIALLAKLNQWFEVAIQAMAIGERAQALDALERCVDERGRQCALHRRVPAVPAIARRAAIRSAAAEARLAQSAAGNITVKVEPLPGVLWMSSRPRWRLTTCLTMARPSPVPPSWRERAASTR